MITPLDATPRRHGARHHAQPHSAIAPDAPPTAAPQADGAAPPPAPRRARPEELRLALAVLLTGRPAPRDPAVDHFINYARTQGMPLRHLWVVEDRRTPASTDPPGAAPRLAAAAASLPAPGAAAMLMLSPPTGPAGHARALALIHACVDDTPPGHRRLLQALLDPEQTREANALRDAGFRRLATLTYLQLNLDGRGRSGGDAPVRFPAQPEGPAELATFSGTHTELFKQTIIDTYTDTRDCPELVGTRTPDEVLDGHRGTGRFTPEAWHCLTIGGHPAGVVLINTLHEPGDAELVYLGVTPAFRRRGLAARLLDHGIRHAADRGHRTLYCAVDQSNLPAVNLYRSRGFRTHLRKAAHVRFPEDA